MNPTRRTLLALGVGAAAAAAGAGALFIRAPARPRERAFTDAAGRALSLPASVARVFPAGPPAAVLLYALAPEKMLGWVRAPTPAERAYLAAPWRDLPAYGRLTGRGDTASLEQVVALAPDLIVDSGEVDRTHASLADRVQAQTAIPYALLDGAFAGSAAAIRMLGAMLGLEARAERLAAYAERVVRESAARVAAAPTRPRVYYGRGPGGLETARAGAITTELLEALGGVNVAAAAGEGGLTNVSPEQILAWDPDIVLAQDERFRAALLRAPLWAGLKAVRERRIFVPPNLPFGWLDVPPGINRLIGAPWLAAILHPQAPAADMRAAAREFYDLFYHVRLSEAQIDALNLDGAPTP